MKMRIAVQTAAWAGAAALGLSLLPQAAAADVINISGIMQVESSTSVEFGAVPAGPFAPAPGTGTFDVAANSATGIFAADGLSGGLLNGHIQSLNEGVGPLSLASPFITFGADGGKLQLFATAIAAPTPALAFGMFNVLGLPGGATTGISFSVTGYILDSSTNTKVDGFQATITSQVTGTPAAFEASLPADITWSTTLATTPLPQGGGVPEPAEWALMIAGFGGAGLSLRGARRRRLAA